MARPRRPARQRGDGDSCIMFRCIVSREVGGEDAQKVVSARGGTGTQQEPPCLQVVYTGDALEEPVLVIALAAEMARDERIVP